MDQGAVIANIGFLACFVVAVVPFFLAKQRHLSDKLVMAWYIFDIIIHTTFDGSISLIMLRDKSVAESQNAMAFVWQEYGKADKRWLTWEPEIFAIEIVAATVMLPLACLNLYLAYINSPKRHFFQVVLSSIEIFGTYASFASELYRGSPNLTYTHPLYFAYYLAFTNGIWVFVPLLLLYHSYCNIHTASSVNPSVVRKKVVIKQE